MGKHSDPSQPKPEPRPQTQDEVPPAASKPGSGSRGKSKGDKGDTGKSGAK